MLHLGKYPSNRNYGLLLTRRNQLRSGDHRVSFNSQRRLKPPIYKPFKGLVIYTHNYRYFSIVVDKNGTHHDNKIRIGHVEREISPPPHDKKESSKHLIPFGYLQPNPSQSTLSHLQWMMTKDNLKQDMLLVGSPGSGSIHKLRLALMYAELTNQEVEVLTLSSDITESDLKQRREIVSRNLSSHLEQQDVASPVVQIKFVDQQPVRAAIKGRILILDGLEKVERNVLPTLNNLLENREMHLEDGRLLVSPERYNTLKEQGIHETGFLTPTHSDFCVIALCAYNGRALDPPLRSRFQIRRIDHSLLDDTLQHTLQSVSSKMATIKGRDVTESNIDTKLLETSKLCTTFAHTMEDTASDQSESSSHSRVLHFPLNHVPYMTHILNEFPMESPTFVFTRSYPPGTQDLRMKNAMSKYFHESQHAFEDVCRKLNVESSEKFSAASERNRMASSAYNIEKVEKVENSIDECNQYANVTFSPSNMLRNDNSERVIVSVACGEHELNTASTALVETDGVKSVLSSMMQEHYVGRDILLLSPRGEGKSMIATEFSRILGYEPLLFSLYREMTSRDLLQKRMTNENGETTWDDSPLIKAARMGQICILDGVEKLNHDTLATLKSLMIDREIWLPNGSKLSSNPLSFRVIALGSIGTITESRPAWLNEDLFSMFASIQIPAYSRQCLKEILCQSKQYSNSTYTDRDIDTIIDFHQSFERDDDLAVDCGIKAPSTRNLLRLVKRGTTTSSLHENICSLFAVELLPTSQRESFDALLERIGIISQPQSFTTDKNSIVVSTSNDEAEIAGFRMKRSISKKPELVPSPHFFDIPSHVQTIKTLLSDWTLGERFFLILGNQGVGKNKLIDRACQIGNFEREYIQLHRDSTVGQLTLSPSLEDGKIVWKDSPLVRAVTEGRSLVIDEADKAPSEVLFVLKSLVADGNLLLADGRRVSNRPDINDSNVIPIHPDFTLWVLANRPGFPFHGNSLMDSIGDCFQIQIIPNPDRESEIELLCSYAPNVDKNI